LAVDTVIRNLGRRLRSLRQARKLTLEALAADTGFTTGYLSQIETGEAIPSLAALSAIAAALGTDISSFFPFQDAPRVHVSRVGDRERFRIAPSSKAEYVMLSARRPHSTFTALIARYFPGQAVAQYSRFGERFALVLEGRAVLHAAGGSHQLAPGDTIHYTSHPEDTLDVVSHHPAEVLWLVVPAMI
jgi:transcriptional regulator with XRE-family HTH domain